MSDAVIHGELTDPDDVREIHAALNQGAAISDDQIENLRLVLVAIRVEALIEAASTLTQEELDTTIEQVAVAYVGLSVLWIAGPALAGTMEMTPEHESHLIQHAIPEDPVFLARLALHLVAIKRDPEIGLTFSDQLEDLIDPAYDLVEWALESLGGRLPHLRARAERYLRG